MVFCLFLTLILQPPVCDTALLPAIDNGNYSATSTNAGDTATAVCDSDYKLTGSNTLECQEDGTWAAAGATCVRKSKCIHVCWYLAKIGRGIILAVFDRHSD